MMSGVSSSLFTSGLGARISLALVLGAGLILMLLWAIR